jgi:SAM-dependent methyltransferase
MQIPSQDLQRQSIEHKYISPYHWVRDPFGVSSIIYFGYVEMALSLLPPSPANVFDAGCGDGRVSGEMLRRGYQVFGCDALEIAIYYARNFVPQGSFFVADLSSDLRHQSPKDLPTFDAVTLIDVYEHIPSKACPTVLNNLRSLIREDGILILSVPSAYQAVDEEHERHFTLNVVKDELEACGWRAETVLYQHRLGLLTKLLFSRTLDRFLNNYWIQPLILKRLRRKMFQWFCNRVPDGKAYGRLLVRARKVC